MSVSLDGVFDAIPDGHGPVGQLSSDEFMPVAEPFDRELLRATGPRIGLVFAADPRGASAVHARSAPEEWLRHVKETAPVPVVALDEGVGVLLRPRAHPVVAGEGRARLL